jgi:hypothetical protein
MGNIPQSALEDSDDPGRPLHLLMQCQRSKIVGGNPMIRATIPMIASVDIAGRLLGNRKMVIGMDSFKERDID